MKNKIYAGCVTVLALLSACQKDNTIEADPAKVEVDFKSPVPGATYRSGDTIRLQGLVSYPAQMHGYELKLVDSATKVILFDDARHVHADNFIVDRYWVADVSQPTTVKLSLVANIDHDGGEARHEFSFTVRP